MKHIVGFSGGVDSQATARWVLNRVPSEDVILLNSNAGGNESRLTTDWVKQYSETVHPVIMLVPILSDMWKTEGWAETRGMASAGVMDFPLMASIKGRFPSRKAQFCTEKLKLAPALRWVRENLSGDDYMRYAGIRREESEARKNTPYIAYDEYFDCEVAHPIFDWTKQMCFDYCKAHGETVNPLYSLGFERVGCAPCVNSGKEDIRRWADRFPEEIDKIRDWEKSVGRTWFAPIVKGIPIWIDEIVAWSRTDHGGKQFNILLSSEIGRPSCESKFGLCE